MLPGFYFHKAENYFQIAKVKESPETYFFVERAIPIRISTGLTSLLWVLEPEASSALVHQPGRLLQCFVSWSHTVSSSITSILQGAALILRKQGCFKLWEAAPQRGMCGRRAWQWWSFPQAAPSQILTTNFSHTPALATAMFTLVFQHKGFPIRDLGHLKRDVLQIYDGSWMCRRNHDGAPDKQKRLTRPMFIYLVHLAERCVSK